MSVFSKFRGREQRSVGDWWLSFNDWYFGAETHAGTQVSQKTAPQLPAVYRCWSLNAETISTLPVDVFRKQGGKRISRDPPLWLEQPNEFQNWCQFLSMVQLSYEADGNAFILKAVTGRGMVAGLYVLAPQAVEPVMRDGVLQYDVQVANGGPKPYAYNEILHISGLVMPGELRGLSPIGIALKETVGTGFAAEQFAANFFGTGATLSGVIELPATAGKFGDEEAARLKESMERKHGGVSKSHALGILTGGAVFKPLSVKPEESQFLETRKYTDTQIAHVYGVPPWHVTDAEGSKGFVTSLYMGQAMWLQTGINPRLVRIERAFSSLLPGNDYIKFQRNAFLQMDPQERVAFYAAGLRDRWLVPNEAREKEDMNPIEGGDKPLLSVQWQDAKAGVAAPSNPFEPPQGQKDEGGQQ